jgi:hypothetical protein
MAQKVEQLLQRGGVTAVNLDAANAPSQIPSRMLGRDTSDADALLSKPSAETRGQQHLPVPGCPGISLIAGPLRERRHVRRQWTLQRPREDHVVIDNALHSGSFFRSQG